MLLQSNLTQEPTLIWPILETSVKRRGLYHNWLVVTDCCFHDLFEAHTGELAGMGLAIIGNLMKRVGRGELSMRDECKLELIRGPGAEPIQCPWPGLPNDAALSLDFEELPWDSVMFLGEKGNFKFRMDRLRLMQRIEAIWCPWLIEQIGQKPNYL